MIIDDHDQCRSLPFRIVSAIFKYNINTNKLVIISCPVWAFDGPEEQTIEKESSIIKSELHLFRIIS